jgi:hypothetical protein
VANKVVHKFTFFLTDRKSKPNASYPQKNDFCNSLKKITAKFCVLSEIFILTLLAQEKIKGI